MEKRKGGKPPPNPSGQPACPCGRDEHPPIRIGETAGADGQPVPMLICPAQSPTGLGGAL